METLMEQKIEETLEAIRTDIAEVNSKVDNLQFINITNGGGRHVTFNRDEFFQMLYDRNKHLWGSMATFSDKALKIGKLIAFTLLSLYAFFGAIREILNK